MVMRSVKFKQPQEMSDNYEFSKEYLAKSILNFDLLFKKSEMFYR